MLNLVNYLIYKSYEQKLYKQKLDSNIKDSNNKSKKIE